MSLCSRNMSGLVELGKNLSLAFSHVLGEIDEGGGRWTRVSLGDWSGKFFNRSPITLKFEAEKLERERVKQERERERARAGSKSSELLLFLRS